MRTKKTKSSTAVFQPKKKNLVGIIMIVIFMAILTTATFFGLKALYQTETYYVLNQDIAARTRITPDMMQERVVSKGGAPQNAISLNQLRGGTIFSKTPLYVGDVLSASNTGLTLDTAAGIPDDWVITSFNIDSPFAVGGQVARGDYFDIVGINQDGAKYLFMDVLALDVNYVTSTNTNDQGQVTSINEEIQYIVGMPPEDAALLAHATDGRAYEHIRIILAPRSVRYKERDVNALEEKFVISEDTPLKALFDGTDSSFTPVLRDDNGRPVNKLYCEAGKVSPMELCDRLGELELLERDKAGTYVRDDHSQTETETQDTEKNPEQP